MASRNNPFSQNFQNSSLIRFLKIAAFSLRLIVSFSQLHQQISKMALRNDPISQNLQESSLLSLKLKRFSVNPRLPSDGHFQNSCLIYVLPNVPLLSRF